MTQLDPTVPFLLQAPDYTGPDLPPEFWNPIDLDGNPMEPPGLGLSKYLLLSNENWAFWCGVWHDCMYDLRRAGFLSLDETSERIDWEFRERCMAKANEDLARMATAVIWHEITRIGGELRWPEPAIDPRMRLAYMRAGLSKIRALKLMGEIIAI